MMARSFALSVAQWRFPALVGTSLLLLYLLTFPGAIAPHISDGRSMYLVTQSLVDRHDVAIVDPLDPLLAHGWQPPPPPKGSCPTEAAVIGVGSRRGGPIFAKYGLGQSLFAVPLYLGGMLAASFSSPHLHAEIVPFVTSAYTALVTALTGALLCALAIRLGWSRRVALALALLYGLATPAWAYTTTFFSEPTIGLCLFGSVASVLWSAGFPSSRTAFLTGCFLAAAVLTRLDSLFYVPIFADYLLARCPNETRLRLLIVLLVPLVLILALIGWYNLARFGSPLSSGYDISGDTHDLHFLRGLRPLWEGVYGLLFSPGKGIFLYAPVLLLLPWTLARFNQERRHAAWLLLAIALVAVIAHANTLIVWLGGWAWGPRFLIPILPVAILPLGATLQQGNQWGRRVAWLLALVGCVIQIPAVLLDKGEYISYLRDRVASGCIWQAEDLYKWHPQYTPIIGQWQRFLDPHTYAARPFGVHPILQNGHLTVLPPTSPIVVGAEGRLVSIPHTWWGLLAAQGASPVLLALIIAVLGLLALLALVSACRASD